jgi:hypothetical protein
MRYVDEALGGIKGVSLMLSGGMLSHAKMMRAIELLGTEVKPLLNAEVSTAPREMLIASASA